MAVCDRCGTSNEEGVGACVRCGALLAAVTPSKGGTGTSPPEGALRGDEPAEDALAALRRLRSMDASATTVPHDLRGAEPSSEEVVPDWLELMLARYGEGMPGFVGLERPRVVSQADSPASFSQGVSTSQPTLSVGGTQDSEPGDLLAEIEQLKTRAEAEAGATAEQPYETESAPAITVPEATVPTAVPAESRTRVGHSQSSGGLAGRSRSD